MNGIFRLATLTLSVLRVDGTRSGSDSLVTSADFDALMFAFATVSCSPGGRATCGNDEPLRPRCSAPPFENTLRKCSIGPTLCRSISQYVIRRTAQAYMQHAQSLAMPCPGKQPGHSDWHIQVGERVAGRRRQRGLVACMGRSGFRFI